MSKLIVYYGGSRSQRNGLLLDHVLRLHRHPRIDFLYLVENIPRRRQVEEVYRRRFPAGFQVPVLTLPLLARRCLGSLGIESLSEPGRFALLDEILRSSDSPARSLQRSGDALTRQMMGIIGRLKRNNVLDPELLSMAHASGTNQETREVLTWCFERYQERLRAQGIEDWAGQLSVLYRLLLTGRVNLKGQFPDMHRLIVEGHTTLAPIEQRVLRLLMGQAEETLVSTDLRPDRSVHQRSPFRELWTLLRSRVDEWHPVEEQALTAAMSVVSLPGHEDEVHWAVSQVRELQDSGCRRIVILSDRPDDYRRDLGDLLTICGQQIWEAGGSPGRDNPLVLLLRDYLGLILESLPRRRLFDFLHHPRLRPGFTPKELDDLEAWAGVCQVEGGLQGWSIEFPIRVKKLLPRLSDQVDSKATEILDLVGRFCDVVARLHLEEGEHSPRGWVRLLEGKLTRLLRPVPLRQGEIARNENRLLQVVLDQCELVGDLLERPVTLRQFSALLQQVARSTRSRVWNHLPDLILAKPEEVEQLEADAVVWLGLCDREFLPPDSTPGTTMEDDPEVDWEEQLRGRELRFGWIAGQSTRALLYTYPRRRQGASTLPSPLLRGLPRRDLGRTETPGPLPDETRRNILRGRRLLQGRESSTPTVFDGVLESARARALISGGKRAIVVSPTLLESYASCGFRHFSEHFLGVGKEEPSADLTPRGLGSMLHRVLLRFMRDMKSPGGQQAAGREIIARKTLLAILEEELDSLPFRDFQKEDLFWSVQETFLRSGLAQGSHDPGLLVEFLRHAERWGSDHTVLELERSFAPFSLGKVDVPGMDGLVEVLLKGTVDRVDRGSAGLVVLDYKTGTIPMAPIYEGWGFQLPLYVALAQEHSNEPVVDAGFYQLELPLKVGVRTVWFPGNSAKGWKRLSGIYRRRALQAVASRSAGRFPITLMGPTRAGCSECSFRDACAFDPIKAEALRTLEGFVAPRPILKDGGWVAGPASEEDSGCD